MIEGSSYALSEVHWDRAILRSQSGAVRELAFKGIENGLDQPIAPGSPNVQQDSSQQGGQTQNAIGQAVQRIQENREQYLQEMGVSPSAGGGFEITARTPAGLRNKLGLQPGDRIMSLNGRSCGPGPDRGAIIRTGSPGGSGEAGNKTR